MDEYTVPDLGERKDRERSKTRGMREKKNKRGEREKSNQERGLD